MLLTRTFPGQGFNGCPAFQILCCCRLSTALQCPAGARTRRRLRWQVKDSLIRFGVISPVTLKRWLVIGTAYAQPASAAPAVGQNQLLLLLISEQKTSVLFLDDQSIRATFLLCNCCFTPIQPGPQAGRWCIGLRLSFLLIEFLDLVFWQAATSHGAQFLVALLIRII